MVDTRVMTAAHAQREMNEEMADFVERLEAKVAALSGPEMAEPFKVRLSQTPGASDLEVLRCEHPRALVDALGVLVMHAEQKL